VEVLATSADAAPHDPQFAPSLSVFTQAPPQLVSPGPQSPTQRPMPHTWPMRQLVPHEPQFAGSLSVLTHTPLQRV